jgi:hypothetical protein
MSCNTDNFVVCFFNSVGFRNDSNSAIERMFLRDQIKPLLIHDDVTCRRNCTIVRGRKLVTIAEDWRGGK